MPVALRKDSPATGVGELHSSTSGFGSGWSVVDSLCLQTAHQVPYCQVHRAVVSFLATVPFSCASQFLPVPGGE